MALMKWEETTGRGSVATNAEGNATINKGNLPKHIFTHTLPLYRMHIKPRWTQCTFLTDDEQCTSSFGDESTTMYIPRWRWTMYIPLWRWTEWNNRKPHSLSIGLCSPKLIMYVHHERRGRNLLKHWSKTTMCWVVFPQTTDKRKVYYWDVLPQITW